MNIFVTILSVKVAYITSAMVCSVHVCEGGSHIILANKTYFPLNQFVPRRNFFPYRHRKRCRQIVEGSEILDEAILQYVHLRT
jgi:hypothetical protein